MFLQDWQRNFRIVGITIIEGDTGGARRQRSPLETSYGFEKGNDVEAVRELLNVAIEGLRVTLVGKQSIRMRQDTVIRKYR